MPLMIAENLSVGYDGHAVAGGIDFKIEEKDYLCIVGENGAGKSTLMRTLLGLLKPVSGSIKYDEKLGGDSIGYLPQQTEVQKDFPATVYEIVLSGCIGHSGRMSFYSREDKKHAKDNMAAVGISELAKKSYRDLSGGQQQRTLLARALTAASSMLVLDEPVAGLDPSATDNMYEIIRGLNEKGMTIVMVSHDMDAALTYSKHILFIGRDIFYGSTEDFLKSSQGSVFASKGGRRDDR